MNASTILDRLDTIINRDDYTRAVGLSVLNNLVHWIENEGNWSFMETLDESQVTVVNQANYTQPTRFKSTIDVSLIDASHNQRFLTEYRGTQMDRYVAITNQAQKPTHFWYFAGSLYLYGLPVTADETIRQRCHCYLADMADSTGSSNALTEYHANLLICGSARDIFNIFEDYDAAKLWNEGDDSKKMCFISEWDSFLKKEGRKAIPSSTPRMGVRIK